MANISLLPLASYPTGVRNISPIIVTNGLSGLKLTIARCTGATPTIWPNTNSRIKLTVLRSYDGGVTFPDEPLWWEQGGGILTDKTGFQYPASNVSFTSDPNPTHIKGTVEVINGPILTKVDLTIS